MKRPGKRQSAQPADILICSAPVPYAAACTAQEQLVARRFRGEIPDTILFVEHPPVVTMGRRGRTDSLLSSPGRLATLGIELVESTRGGDVTYHAPGQIVVYPILSLRERGSDVHAYVNLLEEAAIRTAAEFGVEAHRLDDARGVWTKSGKLAAIGVRVSRGITSHGMSFNVDLDLSGFANIVPCGRHGDRATSLKEILGPASPSRGDVRARLCVHLADLFRLKTAIREVDGFDGLGES